MRSPQPRAAFLASNGTGVPFTVRETGTGRADPLAERRFLDPAQGSGPARRQVEQRRRLEGPLARTVPGAGWTRRGVFKL
ncbi:hypothetical protein AB0E74_23940 [Streptomyces sp. NPDC030392]|uniref:hypothetical protein n=1 Tax=Streptomyces sp. NPDC030392 TaxID=3155468 RepID=UPI00340FA831